MDAADLSTSKLAAELQLADVNAALDGMKEDHSDEYAAFKLMQSTFESLIKIYEGQLLALELLKLDHATQVQCERLLREERQARDDHRLARRLAGLRDQDDSHPPRAESHDSQSFMKEAFQANDDNRSTRVQDSARHSANSLLADVEASAFFSDDTTIAGAGPSKGKWKVGGNSQQLALKSSSSKGKRKADNISTDEGESAQSTHGLCSACMEQHPRFDLLELQCKREGEEQPHAYCRDCLNDLFKYSLSDTALFPPQCCGTRIQLLSTIHLLTPKLAYEYEEKEIELATPNPIYCSNTSCLAFIKPENVKADIASCQQCDAKTCAACKKLSHKELCLEDLTVKMLMDVAKKKKWQKCYKCGNMVELTLGCYHMSCRCGGQFCYKCAKPWKTCSCERWNESRLLADGRGDEQEPRLRENPQANNAAEVGNDVVQQVAAVAQGVATNAGNDGEDRHNEGGSGAVGCAHRWERRYAEGSVYHRCGSCGDYLRYLNNCRNCGTRICNRCLGNRLD